MHNQGLVGRSPYYEVGAACPRSRARWGVSRAVGGPGLSLLRRLPWLPIAYGTKSKFSQLLSLCFFPDQFQFPFFLSIWPFFAKLSLASAWTLWALPKPMPQLPVTSQPARLNKSATSSKKPSPTTPPLPSLLP